MSSAEMLTGYERCGRIPYWGKIWKRIKLKPVEMLEAGVRAGLLEPTRNDYGNVAGEEVYGFGSDPGIDSEQQDQHSEVVHLAALADIVTSAIRRPDHPPWRIAPDLPGWESGCYLSPDGTHLRRIVFVTSWNNDRHYALCRTWETIGEIVHHNLPMELVVVVLGQHLYGKFYSYWTHGLRHPLNGVLRLRKRQKVGERGFKESWIEIWREDYDNISTHDWYRIMEKDEVLQDCLKRYNIAVPEQRQYYIDLAQQKLSIMRYIHDLPMQQLSTCDWPLPCFFRTNCHAQQQPGLVYGFVRVGEVQKIEK